MCTVSIQLLAVLVHFTPLYLDTMSFNYKVFMSTVNKCYNCMATSTTQLVLVIIFIDTSRVFVREVMRKGYVYVTLVKVIIEGNAGVGKTCLMCLLMNKSPPSPEKRRSTDCVERAIQVIRVGKEGEKWSEISKTEFQEMIADAVPILYQELKDSGKIMEGLANILSDLGSVEDEDSREEGEGEVNGKEGDGEVDGKKEGECKVDGKGEGDDKVDGNEEGEGEVDGKEEGDGELDRKEEGECEVGGETEPKKEELGSESTMAGDIKAVIEGVIKKLTELVGSGKSSLCLLDMHLIYITDCGGQQPFWDLIPIFTHDTSVTIFVNRLCEKLDEHPRNDIYQSGEKVGPSQVTTLTTGEAFKTMLRAQDEGGKHSKIITVGTHRDLAYECDETPEQKDEKFTAIASPHFQDDLVYCNDGLKDILFKVNTIDPKGHDKEEASKIRTSIEKCATKHEIPIWWFILQLILEALANKRGREVLSKNECVNISSSLGFLEEELDDALEFFDKLNIFLYKKHVLPGVVFTNPQVPLDKLSKLVKKQYHLKAAEADPTKVVNQAMTGDWQKFRDSAVLTLQLLKDGEFSAHYVDEIFTAADFLELLKKLLIVAPLNVTESSATKYFFPAILHMTAKAQINEYLTSCSATKIAALVVWFPTGWAPPGVYCCSVCHLQSHSHWEVVDKARKTHTIGESEHTHHSQLPHISRNCITFTKHGRPGSVTFIDIFSFFAVGVNVDMSKMQDDDLAKHCQIIRSEIFAAIKAGLENTHHTKSNPKHAFLCPQAPHLNESCTTELHTAHISENGKQWICSQNSGIFSNLTTNQAVWLHGLGETMNIDVIHAPTRYMLFSSL